jgi:plastocyanin
MSFMVSRSRMALVLAVLASSLSLRLTSAAADAGGSISGQVTTTVPKLRAGVVVYLDKVSGSFRPPARPVILDQKGMKFVPHVLAVLKGQTVLFANHDPVSHNIFSPDNEKYNLGTWGQGESKPHTFSSTGIYRQLCNVHPEMGAVIVVLDNPYFAVTGDDGLFKIADVPPGSYTLKTWSEKLPPYSKPITVSAGADSNVHIALGR